MTVAAVTVNQVPHHQHMQVIDGLFCGHWQAEHFVHEFCRVLTGDTLMAFWDYYELSNGGFLLAPTRATRHQLNRTRQVQLSPMALGIAACLYAVKRLMDAKRMTPSCRDVLLMRYEQLQSAMLVTCSEELAGITGSMIRVEASAQKAAELAEA